MGLVVALTPEGRGHVVTHGLYQPRELESRRAKYQESGSASTAREEESGSVAPAYAAATPPPAARVLPSATPAAGVSDGLVVAALRQELADLRNQVAQLRGDLDEMRDSQQRISDEVRALKDALGG
jgi:hypothetical protein